MEALLEGPNDTTIHFPCLITDQPPLPVHLAFKGLYASQGPKEILHDVGGLVRPGEILAIMGPSGCGKTTLLNCLSGQMKLDSGQIYLNKDLLNKRWKRKICYVLQQDIFFPSLTLRQTLEYTARLRLPDTLDLKQKMQYVDHIIQTMELQHCQDTIIGDYLKRGLSGGEKKRANIANELLTNPSLLLLDEPTSGLDSCAAHNLMLTLKKYAVEEEKTVVITLHQPSSQIFHTCDKLLLLCGGQTAYFGQTSGVVQHFKEIGLEMQPYYNPADFILEKLKGPTEVRQRILDAARELSIECPPAPECLTCKSINKDHSNKDFEALQPDDDKRLCMEPPSSASSDTSEPDCYFTWPTSFWTQLNVLIARNFREAWPRMLSPMNWIQTVSLGLLVGSIWYQTEMREDRIHDFQGWMFFSSTYWMLFAHFGALTAFPSEREIVNKERRSGAYRLSAYYLAKMIGELPLTITLPAAFHLISYPLLGIESISIFFCVMCYLLLNTIVAQSAGFFIGACCMDLQLSITVSALFTIATQLFGGYLTTRIPPKLQFMRYLSITHYAYQNMQAVQFKEGLICAQPSKYSICDESDTLTATAILDAQGANLPLWANTLVLIIFFFFFRGLGYIVLRYIKNPK